VHEIDPTAASESINQVVRKAITNGVKIGTDAAVYPPGRNAEESHLLSALGMSPLDAPRAGSSVAGSGHQSVPRPHAHGDQCGRICLKNRKVNLSHVFAGPTVGETQGSATGSGS
jgi:hypothetical protein